MIWLQTAVLMLAGTTGGDTVLLDFYTDGCMPCQQMAPTIEQLVAQGYPVRKIHGGRDPAAAARYGVTAFPTFVLVSDGRVVDGVVGMTSYDRLVEMFEKAAALHGKRSGTDPPANMPARMPSSQGTAQGVLPAVASGPLSGRQGATMVPVSMAAGTDSQEAYPQWTPRSTHPMLQ